MANTITQDGRIVNIEVSDADWTGSLRGVQSIQFNPGAASDKLVVKDGDASGPVAFQTIADGSSDEVIKYFGEVPFTPFIDVSECTIDTTILVILVYAH